MPKIILFLGLVLGTINTSASVLYFTPDMTERIYLTESLFQPSNLSLEHDAARVKFSRAAEQHRKEELYRSSRTLLEELISQVAPVQIGTKLEEATLGTSVALVVEEYAIDPFFYISFGEADTTILRNTGVTGTTNEGVSGIGARKLLENQLKRNELTRLVAMNLRTFYQETDFSSVDIKFGDYNTRFSLSHGATSARAESIFQFIQSKKHNDKTPIEERSSERFTRLIPSFLFSSTFWLVSYLLLCVTIFARGMLRKRLRVTPPI